MSLTLGCVDNAQDVEPVEVADSALIAPPSVVKVASDPSLQIGFRLTSAEQRPFEPIRAVVRRGEASLELECTTWINVFYGSNTHIACRKVVFASRHSSTVTDEIDIDLTRINVFGTDYIKLRRKFVDRGALRADAKAVFSPDAYDGDGFVELTENVTRQTLSNPASDIFALFETIEAGARPWIGHSYKMCADHAFQRKIGTIDVFLSANLSAHANYSVADSSIGLGYEMKKLGIADSTGNLVPAPSITKALQTTLPTECEAYDAPPKPPRIPTP